MGAWGAGLYSSDFALDMRGMIRALSRLPFDGDALLEVACETARDESTNPNHEDYSTFWLVVADQFQKRGIRCDRAMKKAISVVDSGIDAGMMRNLGMTEAMIRKRTVGILELRKRLVSGVLPPRKAPLSKPRPYLMNVGDIYAYPTRCGKNINPYSADVRKKFGWEQSGWSAFIVVDRQRAFEYLPWYAVARLRNEVSELPTLSSLRDKLWLPGDAGTCSPLHMRRLELQFLGAVPFDKERFEQQFSMRCDGNYAAIFDIALSNFLDSLSDAPDPHDPFKNGRLERLPTVAILELIK